MADKKDIVYFAETTFRRQRKKVGIKVDDRRRHVYVIGKTGMGKTAMLENLIVQDMKNGHGVGVIDPHGELADRILDLVPSNRINDVVYIDPSDEKYPFSFNIMENIGKTHRHLIASGLMDVFKKIWPDVWSSRMEYILENSILGLLEFPGSTLLGVNRMLSDKVYRKKVVDNIQDTVVKSFWVNEFANYSPRYKSEATAAIQNKIGQLISNPLIRNIVGQVKSKINMSDVLNGQKILIANLSKGRIGEENSRLLGALLITKLQLAAMGRVDIPESERKDFFLYVDEFQNFATESFANILSEARKYRLCLTLANQYLSQLTEMTSSGGRSDKVRDAVFGNVGTLIVFRVGAEDAEFLEKEFIPDVYAQDLVNLGKYNIYLRLMINGITGRPFSAETLPPVEVLEKSNRDKIIRISREKYCVEKKVIEDKIKRWSGLSEEKKEKTVLYNAVCSICGKPTKVNFLPDGIRPIYCKDCFKKVKEKERETKEKPQEKLKEKIKEKPQEKPQEKKEDIVLEDIKNEKVILENKKKHERKKIDIGELKKALGKALDKNKSTEEE